EQFDAAFEMNYGWTLHGTIKDVASGKKPASAVYEWTEEFKKRYGTRGWQMNFTQNHDENSWNGTERESFGDGGDCFTALCFMIEGMGLIYNGQEASLNKRLLFFNKDEIDWTGKSRAAFFKKLTTLKHLNHALWNGKNGGVIQKITTSDDEKVYAFSREKDGEKVLCIFNLSKQPAGITWESTATDGKWRNAMSDGQTFVTLKKGERKTLQPYEYLIYSSK
ncbi:MAG: alpha-glucosidase C-terminal domain-containing protein, partial [Saprospiraceae bacterium]